VMYQQASNQAGGWLLDTARRKPEALLVIAAGCALLMRSGPSRESARPVQWNGSPGRDRDGLSNKAKEASATTDTAKAYASKVADTVSEYTETARRTASSYADGAKRSISDTSDWVRAQAETTYKTASETLREQPILVAALGLAAGAALAALFPATEVERRAGAALAAKASDVGDNVLAAAEKAGERLKETVAERGLDPSAMKDVAREVVGIATAAVGASEQPSAARTGKVSDHPVQPIDTGATEKL